jgi:magnesium-transporting ATPase (P-type)
MLIHQLPLDSAFSTLRSTPTGLSRQDAESRRREFGPNRIEPLPTTPLFIRFISQFTFLHVPLALTIVQILAVELGTDILPALGLGAESSDASVMRRPPRTRRDRLVTPGLLVRAYAFLGTVEAVAAMAAFFFVLLGSSCSPSGQPC